MPTNPYDWTRARTPWVPETVINPMLYALRRGEGVLLVGGRGMGKSRTLAQVAETLAAEGSAVAFLSKLPASPTVAACLAGIGKKLGVQDGRDLDEILDELHCLRPDVRHVVVIVDEVDQLARSEAGAAARDLLNHLEAVRREPRRSSLVVGVLAAAGVGALLLQHVLGSAFVSRAARLTLHARDASWVAQHAKPFSDEGRPLEPDLLDAVRLGSGGVPALITYLLQALWAEDAPDIGHIGSAMSRFRSTHRPFIQDVRQSVTSAALDDRPWRLFEALERAEQGLARSDAQMVLSGSPGLDLHEVLVLLQAAGLLIIDDLDAATLNARTTLAPLWGPSDSAATRFGDFHEDLGAVAVAIARNAPDLRSGKDLVQEAVFSLLFGLGMEGRGWSFDREPQRGAGRTDLLLRRGGATEEQLVEVKIWGRNDYRAIQNQVLSYCSAGTLHVGAIMLADGPPQNWTEVYRKEVLSNSGEKVETPPGLTALYKWKGTAPDGSTHEVLHYLVPVARRQ